jgi:hypothetical protein
MRFLRKFQVCLYVYFFIRFAQMAHNVPAVYDVLAARIRALRSKDQGRQNVAEVCVGRSEATDLANRNPEPPTGSLIAAQAASKRKQLR